jgi:hypothetical protein
MMKSIGKLVVPVIAMIMLSSCSSSKNATVAKRNDVKGTWTLNNISYEGLSAGEKLHLTLLDEGTEACLTGSTWTLPNNGYGSYTITNNQSGCIAGEKNIIWSYRKENGQAIIQYKKLESGVKAKDIEEGYKFKLLTATAETMTWQSEISFAGHPVFINYSFSKK